MVNKKGDSFATAFGLGEIQKSKIAKGVVSKLDKVDFFKFQLLNRSSLSINARNLQSRINVQLFDSAHHLLSKNSFAKSNQKSPRRELSASTYYISVQYRGNLAQYQLGLKSKPTNDNTLANAKDLGILASTLSTSDFVGTTDGVDYYRFTLNQNSNLQVSFTGKSAGIDVNLISDKDGNRLIDDSEVIGFNSGRNNSFFEPLPAGTYFVGVKPSGSTRYGLTLTETAQPGNVASDPGSRLSTAYDLGTLSGTDIKRDYVGDLDSADLYKFTLNQNSNLQVRFTGTSAGIDVNLISDKNGNGLIDDSEVIGYNNGQNNSFSRPLPAGTYFVKVRPYGSTQYGLTLAETTQPGNVASDPGSMLSTAYNLGTLSGTDVSKDYVGDLDGADLYKFTLNQNSDLQVHFTGASASIDVNLISDKNGNGLIDSDEVVGYNNGQDNSFSEPLPAGTYFVKVRPYGSTQYDLTLTETAQPGNVASDPGSTLSTAYDLGTLSGTDVSKDYVGDLDSTDLYKFTLNQNSDLQVHFTGASAGIDVNLISDKNGNGLIDSDEVVAFSGGQDNSFSKLLLPGTYFVKVRPYASTQYDLTLIG